MTASVLYMHVTEYGTDDNIPFTVYRTKMQDNPYKQNLGDFFLEDGDDIHPEIDSAFEPRYHFNISRSEASYQPSPEAAAFSAGYGFEDDWAITNIVWMLKDEFDYLLIEH